MRVRSERRDREHRHAVRSNRRIDRTRPAGTILVRPEVADFRSNAGRIAELFRGRADRHWRFAAVEQEDGTPAAGKRLHPYLAVDVLPHAVALRAEPVL